MKQEYPLTGMPIVKRIDGVVRNLSRLPDKTLRRIEMVGEMNDRRKLLRQAGDWRKLEKLADEYAGLHMDTMAAHIRQEAYGIKTSKTSLQNRTRGRDGEGGGVRKTAKRADVGAVGLSGNPPDRDAKGGEGGTRRAADRHRVQRQRVSPPLKQVGG